MSANFKRKRSKRVSTLDVAPSGWLWVWSQLRRQDVLLRSGIGLLGAILLWAVVEPWSPPFPYRQGHAPPRDILSVVSFKLRDDQATLQLQDEAANQIPYVFEHDPQELVKLRETVLPEELSKQLSAKKRPKTWVDFMPPASPDKPYSSTELDREHKAFRESLSKEGELELLLEAIAKALSFHETNGILDALPQEEEGQGKRADVVVVFPKNAPEQRKAGQEVPVSSLFITEQPGRSREEPGLRDGLASRVRSIDVADHIYHWLAPRLPTRTLTFMPELTQDDRQAARDQVGDQFKNYAVGQTLAQRGEPFSKEDVELLRAEHEAAVAQLTARKRILLSCSALGMIATLYGICGSWLVHNEPRLVWSLKRLGVMLVAAAVTVGLARWLSVNNFWRAEIIPLLFFAM
ncbi:MAG: hypothetical protein N2C14_17340, partial [Planctomycetales bacterium]